MNPRNKAIYWKERAEIFEGELRALKRENRKMFRALCRNCKLYNCNGAGEACLARNWQNPTMSTCPLLKNARAK